MLGLVASVIVTVNFCAKKVTTVTDKPCLFVALLIIFPLVISLPCWFPKASYDLGHLLPLE